jgi:hypothetical protein
VAGDDRGAHGLEVSLVGDAHDLDHRDVPGVGDAEPRAGANVDVAGAGVRAGRQAALEAGVALGELDAEDLAAVGDDPGLDVLARARQDLADGARAGRGVTRGHDLLQVHGAPRRAAGVAHAVDQDRRVGRYLPLQRTAHDGEVLGPQRNERAGGPR